MACDVQVQLSELVGLKGSVGQRRVVMGIIGTSEAGSFTLEDTGGLVPLDLSQATVAAGFVTGVVGGWRQGGKWKRGEGEGGGGRNGAREGWMGTTKNHQCLI
jgi:hypothetical protein